MLTQHSRDGECGNVALTSLVLMVVSLLAMALFLDARRSLIGAKLEGGLGQAEAAAELGVSEALARIDGGETVRFTGAGTIGSTDYGFTAEPSGDATWTVTARGGSGNVTRTMVATIGREPLFPHTVFGVHGLVFDRNTGLVAGRVGTNGSIEVNGPSPGEVQELYRPDGTCRRCTDPLVLDGPRPVPAISVPGDPVRPCPTDGRFVATVDGHGGTPYVCEDVDVPVVFEGEVLIDDPPLVVHVGAEVGVSLAGAVVNPTGAAADFRLFVAGESGDAVHTIGADGGEATGLLYGPGRRLVIGDTTWTGSMTLGRVEVTRNGRLTVSEDTSIAALGSAGWRIVALRTTGAGR